MNKTIILAAVLLIILSGCVSVDEDGTELYTVTFEKNSSSATNSMAEQKIQADTTAVLSVCTFTNSGYNFAGWSLSSNGTVKYSDGGQIVMGRSNVVLYAVWEPHSYTLSFNANSPAADGTMDSWQLSYASVTNLPPCSYTVSGSSFAGWAVESNGSIQYTDTAEITMGAGDLELFAVWTNNTVYTVTFDSRGGSAVSNLSVESGQQAVEPVPPERDGWSFAGWYSDSNLTSVWDFSGQVLSNMTLYAKWSVPYSEMIQVPGGTWTQQTGDESFTHTITQFEIGKYEVTYNLWRIVHQWALTNGYTFANSGKEGNSGTAGAPAETTNQPATAMNWHDALVWCNAYSEWRGYQPVYNSSGGAVLRNATEETSCETAQPAWNNNGYRLPTESEWQYAAAYQDGSSWTATNRASGAADDTGNASATGAVAVYGTTSVAEVGSKAANQLQIYDMSGNVAEWCWDWYAAWPSDPQTDYPGPVSGSGKVLRGGSWNDSAGYLLRLGYRDYETLFNIGDSYTGFRVVRHP